MTRKSPCASSLAASVVLLELLLGGSLPAHSKRPGNAPAAEEKKTPAGETQPSADAAGADPAGADPAEADSAGADPAGADPAGADPAGADPASADPAPFKSPVPLFAECDWEGGPKPILHRDVSPSLLGQLPEHLRGDLRGRDLRKADLRGLNFSGKDLTGADLRETDLRGANLIGADLTRAQLAGAVLFNAQTQGAKGLDLLTSGARLHPFFETPAGTPFGAVKIMALHGFGGAWEDPPVDLCSHRGALVWRSREQSSAFVFHPTGSKAWLDLAGGQTVSGMFPDTKGNLWILFEDCFALVRSDHLLGMHSGSGRMVGAFRSYPAPLGKPVVMAAGAAGLGHFWYPGFSVTCEVEPDGAWKEGKCWFHKLLPSCCECRPGARAAADPRGRYSAIVHPDEDAVMVHIYGNGTPLHMHLEKGSRPSDVVIGPDGLLRVALSGTRQVYTTDPLEVVRAVRKGKTYSKHSDLDLPAPRQRNSERRGLVRLALDGNGWLWFADPEAGCIGWVAPDGKRSDLIELGEGMRPLELVRATDGGMLFTLEGQPLIGAIVTANPPEDSTEYKAAPVSAAAESKAAMVPKKLSAAERRKLAGDRDIRACERYLAAQALAGEALSDSDEDDEPKGKAEERKGDSKGLEAESAEDAILRLSDLGVSLVRQVNRSIRWKHCNARNIDKSQFAPDYHQPEALTRLIADGLEGAGVIGRIPSTDGSGRFLTRCRLKGGPVIGHLGLPGGYRNTSTFMVVTDRAWNGTDYDYDVVTAFPVPDRW